MKRSLTVIGAAAILLTAAMAWAQTAGTAPTTNDLVGDWELVSSEYNGQPNPVNQREVKMISPKHFMWMAFDKEKMKTVGAGMGTWTLEGNTYTEHVHFIDVQGGESLNGKDASFTVSLDGNTLTQSGVLAGMKMKEVWKRAE